jgi:hypothetical protein
LPHHLNGGSFGGSFYLVFDLFWNNLKFFFGGGLYSLGAGDALLVYLRPISYKRAT